MISEFVAPEKFGRFLLGSYCSGGAATAIQYSALTNRITAVLSACTTANSLSTYHVFYYRSNADKDSVAGPKHALAVFNLANRLRRARSLLSPTFFKYVFFFCRVVCLWRAHETRPFVYHLHRPRLHLYGQAITADSVPS